MGKLWLFIPTLPTFFISINNLNYKMRLTISLIILFTLIFFISLQNFEFITNYYGLSFENVQERPYVMITSVFLHGDMLHLVSNIFVLFFFGIAVESEVGKKKTLIFFLLGALLGNIFALFYYEPTQIAIGASGGIFALVGAGMILKPLDMSLYPFVVPMPLAFLGAAYIIYNIYGFFFEKLAAFFSINSGSRNASLTSSRRSWKISLVGAFFNAFFPKTGR